MDFSTWPSTILTIGVGLLVVIVLFFLIALALRLLGWIFRILGAFLAIAFYPLAVVIILLLAGVGWYQYRPPSNVRAETAISNRMRCDYRYGATMVQRKYTNGVIFYRCEGSKSH